MANYLSRLQSMLGMGPNPSQGIASLPQPIPEPEPIQEPQELPEHWQQFSSESLPKDYVQNPENLRFKMYAAGTNPKNTDPKTGLESMPIRDRAAPVYDDEGNKVGYPLMTGEQVYAIARGMGATKQHGVVQLPPEQLAGMILQEGRADLGNNIGSRRHPGEAEYYDPDSHKQADMFSTLTSSGLSPKTASWLTKATAKQSIAKRLKIPFGLAWNGTGTSEYQTGAQYSKELDANIKAARHPKNAQLLDLIKQGYQAGLDNPMNPKQASSE